MSVENWAYVFIKLKRVQRNRLLPRDVPRLEAITTVEEFRSEILKYYPSLSLPPTALNIIQFEVSAWKDYFHIATRIINASPQSWQNFIFEYLLKFQIKDLKTILLGKIADLSPELIKSYILWDAEDILNTKRIMELLLTQKTPREILYTLRNSRYGTILREGLAHYFNDKDPFYFQIYLDRFYYLNLSAQDFHLPAAQLSVVKRYIDIESEFYNVRTIYRCLINNFDPRIITELLVPSNFFLTQRDYAQLIESRTPVAMAKKYITFFLKDKRFKFFRENPVEKNLSYFIREFYAREQLQPMPQTEEIELQTFNEIFRILKLREYVISHFTQTLIRIKHHAQFNELDIIGEGM